MGISLRRRQKDAPPATPPPPPPTLQDMVRTNKRNIDRSCRDLDRERQKLESQERSLQMQIRKVAREGQMETAKVMAKDLVRTRQSVTKMYQMRAQMQSVSTQMATMQSSQGMSEAMSSAVKSMMVMNAEFNIPSMQKTIMDYQKQTGKMEMTQEMVDDAMDSAMGTDEAEQDDVLAQVIDELGLEAATALGTVGVASQGVPQSVDDNQKDAAELEGRMADLQRNSNNK